MPSAKRTTIALLLVAFAALQSSYGYDPPKGAFFLRSLYSPWGLASTPTTTGGSSSWADLLNPSATGAEQLIQAAASYTGISDLGLSSPSQGWGSAAALSLVLPESYGVWEASALFFSAPSSMTSMGLGTYGSLRAGISKALMPSLLVGTSLGVTMGGNGSFGWGVGLDLGATYLAGDIGFLKDTRFGLSILDVGKGYSTATSTAATPFTGIFGGTASSYPSAFTLGLGGRGYLYRSYNWNLDAGLDLWSPSFQDLDIDLSLGLAFREYATLKLGWSMGLRDTIQGSGRSFLPSIGLSGTIPLGGGLAVGKTKFRDADLSAALGFAPLYDSLWATSAGFSLSFGIKDKDPPVIEAKWPVAPRGIAYISPNGDGSGDSLDIPVKISDARYLAGWQLKIEDRSSGKVVRTIGASLNKQDALLGFEPLKNALLSMKQSVSVPDVITWDGKDDKGMTVPDGPYTVSLVAWDDNDNYNLNYQSYITVVVDARKPQASATPLEQSMILSPDGDGSKDSISFRDTGSVENSWKIEIADAAGNVVRTTTTAERSAPKDYTWDGTADDGKRVPDGFYSLRLSTKDEAGNAVSSLVSGIEVDTSRPAVSIVTDDTVMSPNGDGVKDSLNIVPTVESFKGMESWEIYVLNADRKKVWSVSGNASTLPQQSYRFDGLLPSGSVVDDGQYEAGIDVRYRNGYQPQKISAPFYSDRTPPSATIALADKVPVFSPDGDGNRDSFSFAMQSSDEDSWNLVVRDAAKNAKLTKQFAQNLPDTFMWDGKDGQGKVVPDGDYEVDIFAVDRAGNSFSASSPKVRVDTRHPTIKLGADKDAFSPNGDGVAESVKFTPEVKDKDGFVDWKFTISAKGKTPVEALSLEGKDASELDSLYEFKGLDGNGKALPEGIYTASLDVDYINGYRAHVESAEVLLDRTYPTATVKPDKTVFNPAGKADQSKVSFVQSGSDEELWLAKVVTDSGITVKRWSFQGQLPTIVWDGSADSGLPAPDGFYKYFVSSTDRAGNAFKSAEFPIEIDSVKKELKLSASALAFSPNGDGIKDRLEIAADATASAKIASWALSIYQADSADRKAIKTWAGTGQLQKSFAWDGMADSGIQAPDGAYSASLEVSYPNGDKAKTELNSIVLDRIAPKAKVAISAGLFSPNGDGVLDQTTIQQEALTSDQWKGSIANAKGEVVRSWAWDGKLADQAWDGLDQVGSLVADGTYYYELTSADAAGNSFSSGKLPIGVETEKKTVRLDIDQLAFSPNGDGIRDELTLASAVQAPDRVKDYELKVVAQEGPAAMTAVRTWKGSGSVAPKLIWRGETDAGLQAPDGKYAARLTIHYLNGDTLDSSTPAFIVDRIVPKVEVKADLDIISPNGDGIADQVRFTQSSVPGDDWKGTIAGTDGKVVRNLAWKNEVADFAWDGRDDTGAIVKDGQYTYRVESTDVAGNRGSSSPITIAVETEQKAVSMTVAALAFSPNGDGIKDNLTFLVKAQYPERVKQFDLTITQDGPAASSLPVRSWKGSTDIGTQYVWNGTTDSGIQAPDGQYRAKLTVIYRNGDLHHIDLGPIVLDRVAPKATVRLSTPIFSPNGDGVMDSVDIVQEAVPGDLWQGQITSSANAVVRSWTWKDRLETVTWDGRNQVGAQVPDGQYSYELRSEDAAGNSFSSGKLPIEVDAAKRMVRLDIDQRAFSPNGDGIRDELALASTVQSPERVKDYELRIVAQEGPAAMTTVRAWKGTGSVMPKLIWRGETDTGLQVPDGKYAASLTIHYLNGDALDNSTPTFLVDRIAPKVDVSADLDIISPNGDGRSDQVRFTQSSVPGDDWKGTITGADGKVVKNLGWKNEVADFVWDGRDDAGAIVKDGKYTYQLNSSDAAGNRGQSAPIVVAVETEKKQVTMEASTFAFSPNGDGVKDNLTFLVKVQYPERVKQFDLTITQDGPGTSKLPVRVWKGSTDIGTQFVWDGTTDSGIQAPDGQYRAKLTVLYRNDDLKQVELGPITLDRQAPQATVRLSTPIFSPNGDGIKDTVDIVQEAVPGDLWQGQITSSANAVVRSWTWKDKLETVTWDGKNQAKIQVPDGQYSYELKSVDAAGNSFSSGKLPIEVDAAKKTVRMDVDQRAFSPNGDGVKDQLYINIIAPKPESITEYEIGVYALDQAGKRQVNPIRMWRGASDIKDQYAWDGKTESGIAAPDGRYQVTFKLLYNNGDAFAQVSPEVVIDTVAPSISVDAAPLVFSPNGDGNKDTISFTQKSNLGDDWTGRIRNASGSVIRTYTWKSEAKSFVWDGKDAAGTLVKDGVYSYEVSATDLAGNTASAKIAGITVDGTKPKVYVSASDTGISPNDDGIRDDVSFTIVVEQREGIESWRFSLIDKQGNEKSYFGGTGSDVPSRLVWDGRDLQGQVVQGEYVGKLVVTYAKGDVATASSAKVLVDANPPVVSIDVKPEYFSPDGDGVGDTLTFSIKADSGSAIVDWKLEVYEKAVVETSAPEETTQGQERLFMDWSGKSNPPATISWNGLSSRKELVESATDYPFKFVARDALGNTTTVAGIIAVDVLVIRDGDRLKIQVPSIVFRANYADFNGLAPEIMDRNKKVITRIAQILNKFPDYRINIQGHANNVGKMMGLSAAKIQTEETKELIPLSTGRAELVRTMLVQSGVDARRLSTEGLGSSEPVVSFTDVVNRWKNRRVEFVLIKNQ